LVCSVSHYGDWGVRLFFFYKPLFQRFFCGYTYPQTLRLLPLYFSTTNITHSRPQFWFIIDKKGQGSTQNNRDSAGRRLGVKKYGGESVIPGNIILRQRGTKVHAGTGVGMGKDHTIFAIIEGTVQFSNVARGKKRVSVIPA